MARSVTEIQADLTAAYAARRAAFQAQSYSMDSGQGRQSVTRADLKAISLEISILEQELEDADTGSTGMIYSSMER